MFYVNDGIFIWYHVVLDHVIAAPNGIEILIVCVQNDVN